MNKKIFTSLCLLLFLSAHMEAQVGLNGLGRVYMANDHLDGNINQNDTISENAGTGGYILFDLGMNINPNDLVKANIILRARNEFGGFYGDGATFDFRQFYISGKTGSERRNIGYHFGDMDVVMTPYTMYNFAETFYTYEAEIFNLRKDIVHYENFNFDNKWRIQGMMGETGFAFDKLIKSAKLRAFATRTKTSQNFQFPDRLILGGDLRVVQSRDVQAGINYVHLTDVRGTVRNAGTQHKNGVITGDIRFTKDQDDLSHSFAAEGGRSDFMYNEFFSGRSRLKEDFFYDFSLSSFVKSLNLKINASYRSVGPDFISASAQTRRLLDYERPFIFGMVQQASVVRIPNLFDRLSQEQIYNQTINPVLMDYNLRYNLVTPYGRATPNRRGFTAGMNYSDKAERISAAMEIDMLSEIVGEGIQNLRKFQSFKGGSVLNIGKFIGFQKEIKLMGGVKREISSREDFLVNFRNTHIDLGLNIELIKDLSLISGLKLLRSGGNELIALRDEFNDISDYRLINETEANSNITDRIYAIGGKYRFSDHSVFSVQYHLSSVANFDNAAVNYSFSQLFFLYSLKF